MTWPGGAKAVDKTDFSQLAGRDVIILPDADEPGEEAADRLVGILHQAGVKRLRRWKAPSQCPSAWDIADEPPAGITAEAIVDSIIQAPAGKK